MWRGWGPDAIPALQELTGVEKESKEKGLYYVAQRVAWLQRNVASQDGGAEIYLKITES